MRKALRKIALGCAAAMSLSAVLSASAFAADLVKDTDFTVDSAAGTVSVTESFASGKDAGQYTVLIYKNGEGVDDTNLQAEQILYINQDALEAIANGENTGTFQNMGLKTMDDGEYTIKIGGDALEEIFVGTFTVGGGGTEIILGDVTGEGDIDAFDAAAILEHYVGITPLSKEKYAAADVTGEGDIDAFDAAAVLEHYVGITPIVQPSK